MNTSIEIAAESVSGYCEKLIKRASGERMADLYLLFEIKNIGAKRLKIDARDIEISTKDATGRLIVVEESRRVNEKLSINVPAKATRAIKARFTITESQYSLLQQEISAFTITVADESFSIPLPSKRIVNSLLKWPK